MQLVSQSNGTPQTQNVFCLLVGERYLPLLQPSVLSSYGICRKEMKNTLDR